MRFTCLACATDYQVADAVLGPLPRAVRCASCGHVWTLRPPPLRQGGLPLRGRPRPPPPADTQPPSPPQVPAVIPTLRTIAPGLPPPAPPRAGSAAGAMLAWGVSLALLAGLAVAVWQNRAAIEAAWPPAARAYGWVDRLR